MAFHREKDYRRVYRAISLTRQIRTGAFLPTDRSLSPDVAEVEEQNALRDAVRIAEANAQLFLTDGSVDERRIHFDTLVAELNQVYGNNREYTSQGQFYGTIINYLASIAHDFDRNWADRIRSEYERNGFPQNIEEILSSQDFGIIAPLSADFLIAKLIEAGQRKKGLGHPPVYPMAPRVVMRRSVMPKDVQGRSVFAEKSQIGVYLDNIETGGTLNEVVRAVKAEYPMRRVFSAPPRLY